MNYSEILKTLRKSQGLSQSQLAEITGFSQTAISQWERGDRKPNVESMAQLSDLYDVPIDELMGKTPAPVLEERLKYYNAHNNYAGESKKKTNIKVFRPTSVRDYISKIVPEEDSSASKSNEILLNVIREVKLKSIIDMMDILNEEGLGRLADITESLACNPRFRKNKYNSLDTIDTNMGEEPEENTDNQKEKPGE